MGADDDVHRPLRVTAENLSLFVPPVQEKPQREKRRGERAPLRAPRASTTARVSSSRPWYHAQSHNAHQPVDPLPGVTTQQINASVRTHALQPLAMER